MEELNKGEIDKIKELKNSPISAEKKLEKLLSLPKNRRRREERRLSRELDKFLISKISKKK